MRWIVVSGLVVVTGCGMLSMGAFTRVPIPSEIAPAASQKLDRVVAASGTQIYRCDPKSDAPGQFEWVFQAPAAMLREPAGKYLGKHYAGPTWEAEDGSKIVGTVQARRDAPDGKSIPWLRVATRSTGGPGLFANVTTVLRVATSGGAAPSARCDAIEQGKIVRVPYSADYNLYVTR